MTGDRRTFDHMDAVLDQIGALPMVAVVLLIAAAMFVDASPIVGLLLPGDLLVVTVVASVRPEEAVLAMAGVVVGTLASWSLFFYLGSRIGPRLRMGRLGRWIGRTRWDNAEQLLTGRGARALTLVQFLPVLNAVVPLVAGVLGMRYRQFVRFAAPGTALWAACFCAVGVWAGIANNAVFGESGSPLQLVIFGAPGFLAGWFMLVLLRRELVARRAAGTWASPAAEPQSWDAQPLTNSR